MATRTLDRSLEEFHYGIESRLRRKIDACQVAVAVERRQMLVLPDEDTILRCLSGELWLTRERDSEDYVLAPGQSFTVRRGDQAVVQALRPSCVRLLAG